MKNYMSLAVGVLVMSVAVFGFAPVCATSAAGTLCSTGILTDGTAFSGCGTLPADEMTKIHSIQGSGDTSPLEGETQTIEGIVVIHMQGGAEPQGFFIQAEDFNVDDDPATSEGLFVYSPGTVVEVGDLVQVTGNVSEYNGLTQLSSVTCLSVLSSGVPLPAVTAVDLPVPSGTSLERYEGMLLSFPEELTVSQNYFQGRYGQVTLSAEGRLYQPTNLFAPGSPEAIALADENLRRMLVLDDGSSSQNPFPIPYIGVENTLRAGDVLTGLIGVLDNGLINNDGTIHYRLHPTESVNFTRANERMAAPKEVGGTVKVSSFNVLNYFNGDGLGGGFPTPRGANNPDEFTRQRDKIVTAIATIDADVIGLMEIENDEPGNSAIEDLVNGLNDAVGVGTYRFINTGKVGEDEIRVALLYKPGTIAPAGDFAVLDSSVDASFNSEKNRPALAQTFAQKSSGEKFTVVVNHLKSKGSSCDDVNDPDTGDGQGNCNLTRTRAAQALTNWLAGDPTGSGDSDVLIIGDLNAYAMEAPIAAIRDAGYVNLFERFGDADAYSFVFDGQSGYLEHVLASPSLAAQIAGVNVWHINADEPSAIDYNTEFKSQDLYRATPYRASDHDPVVLGIQLRRKRILKK